MIFIHVNKWDVGLFFVKNVKCDKQNQWKALTHHHFAILFNVSEKMRFSIDVLNAWEGVVVININNEKKMFSVCLSR